MDDRLYYYNYLYKKNYINHLYNKTRNASAIPVITTTTNLLIFFSVTDL